MPWHSRASFTPYKMYFMSYVNKTVTSSGYTYLGKDADGNPVYRDDNGQLFNTPPTNEPEPAPRHTPPPDWRGYAGDNSGSGSPFLFYPPNNESNHYFNPVTNR